MQKHIIPLWSPIPEYQKNKKSIHKSIERVLLSGQLILGKEVSSFEKEFARFCTTQCAIGVASGTDALILSLRALGLQKGDEVITVANSDIATAMTIITVGATPVFVDVLPETLLMDPSELENAITRRTKAIIPVHLFGQMCDMDKIMNVAKKHKLFVIEDCAQAAGAEYQFKSQIPNPKSQKKQITLKKAGSMGDIGAFSFYPTKILGAYGDAGLIVTNNKKLADTIKLLRMRGTKGDYYARIHGMNSRLDELQAAVLRVKLSYISRSIRKRRAIAKKYLEGLIHTPLIPPTVNPDSTHVWHQFVIRYKKRDALKKFLEKKGIMTHIHYPFPLHLMPAYTYLGYKKGDLPIAEKAAKEVLSLPLYPELSISDQDRIIYTIVKFFK